MLAEDPHIALARQWLAKSRRDLMMAERAATGEPPLLDMAAFHWQQAAEKALKGYLAWSNRPFRRTHDLVELLNQCEVVDGNFTQLRTAADRLSPYAVEFRYPGAKSEPTAADAVHAERLARETLDFVLTRLPFLI
jgi:HEPN domain-containing protein